MAVWDTFGRPALQFGLISMQAGKYAKLFAIVCIVFSSAASAEDRHALLTSKYWFNIGAYFAARNFEASAKASVLGAERQIDFESAFGIDDKPELFTAEVGWQFGEKWGLGLQYFDSERSARKTLEETVEWQELIFDVGIDVRAKSEVSITRVFFSRDFRADERQSLRLGAGLHWLDVGARIEGTATLADQSQEFRRSVVSTSAPIPNLGAWYRYSPSRRWLLSARIDWLSASVGNVSGSIWNVAAGTNYQFSKHFGVGLAYQFFQIDGDVREEFWRGTLKTRFSGPNIYLSGYW